MRYYFAQEVDGKKNPCFGNATKAGLRVGYSDSYAKVVLHRIQESGGELSKDVIKSRENIHASLKEAGIGSEWFANIVKELGESRKQAFHKGKFVDSKYPDTFAARVALENVAKIIGLYEPETLNLNIYDNLNDAELDQEIDGIAERIFNLRKIKRSRSGSGNTRGRK